MPYRGGGALLPDVIGGSVDGAMTEFSTALPLHKAGQARIIGGRRASSAPSSRPTSPTFDESGVEGFPRAQSFIGILAPAKTPPEIVAQLQKAVAEGLTGGPAAEKLIAARLGDRHARADDLEGFCRLHPRRLRRDGGGRQARRPQAAVEHDPEKACPRT